MKKRAQYASDDENAIPGTHADASPKAGHIMKALIRAASDAFPGTLITVVVMDGENADRFNYASNCNRKDMIAVLKALVKRMETEHNQ